MSFITRASRALLQPQLSTKRAFHATCIAREHFLDADSDVFKKRVLDESLLKPILVDFYATWCQPCKVLTPLLKNVTSPESGYDLMTVNVDDHPELAGEFKVTALPTVVAFKSGKVANKFVGFRPEAEVQKFLRML